ncbi:MAG: IS200/IS605 family transposase [Leptolyngbyaceae cyanobacterium CSU_1_3]|nr:IS200/IS605 family transposase [Leptolyngbyaceae cyanobacterium CSU_1_3]
MRKDFKSNSNIVYCCKFHVIFCPKYRRKVLINGVDARFKEILAELATELKFDVEEVEVMPDHVHVLIDGDPQFGIHQIVKRIKGRSSKMLRDEFPWLKSRIPTLWTNSYFVATVGGAPLEVIKQYIADQKTK